MGEPRRTERSWFFDTEIGAINLYEDVAMSRCMIFVTIPTNLTRDVFLLLIIFLFSKDVIPFITYNFNA